MTLPMDNHVHSEWSWDALSGSMEGACVRAVELGLPAVAFTEHADFTPWLLAPGDRVLPEFERLVDAGNTLTPPAIDLEGYRDCLERCRSRHPGLRIHSGVELGEPHWHRDRATALLADGGFGRVLASLHSAATADGYVELSGDHRLREPDEVLRNYLRELARMIEEFEGFEVLAHIDYPVRSWPSGAAAHDPREFEDEYRHVLRTLARADKILEVNTTVPLDRRIVRWWHEEGGHAVTFASDAHTPSDLARGFAEAADMAEAAGFRPTADPYGYWARS